MRLNLVKKPLDRRRVLQIEFAVGSQQQIAISHLPQLPNQRGTDQAGVSGDVDSRGKLHTLLVILVHSIAGSLDQLIPLGGLEIGGHHLAY